MEDPSASWIPMWPESSNMAKNEVGEVLANPSNPGQWWMFLIDPDDVAGGIMEVMFVAVVDDDDCYFCFCNSWCRNDGRNDYWWCRWCWYTMPMVAVRWWKQCWIIVTTWCWGALWWSDWYALEDSHGPQNHCMGCKRKSSSKDPWSSGSMWVSA